MSTGIQATRAETCVGQNGHATVPGGEPGVSPLKGRHRQARGGRAHDPHGDGSEPETSV